MNRFINKMETIEDNLADVGGSDIVTIPANSVSVTYYGIKTKRGRCNNLELKDFLKVDIENGTSNCYKCRKNMVSVF